MDLVNQYLRAVAVLLPKGQREDITAELRDTILNRIEEREEQVGHRLTEDETETVLHEIGHPIVVSARYREGPQHAVGPALYPYWAFAVKVAVTIQAIIAGCIILVRVIGGHDPGQAVGQALGSVISGTMMMVGFITVAGWMIERRWVQVGELKTWRVRDLHMLEFASWDWNDLKARLPSGGSRPPREPKRDQPNTVSRGIGHIVGGALFILWWIGVFPIVVVGDPADLPAMGLDLGTLGGVDWLALKAALFWPVLAYALGFTLQGVVILTQPRAMALVGFLDMLLGATMIGITAWLWAGSPISDAIRFDSLSAWGRAFTDYREAWPKPIAPILTVVVVSFAFAGFVRMLHGVWEIAAGVGLMGRRQEA